MKRIHKQATDEASTEPIGGGYGMKRGPSRLRTEEPRRGGREVEGGGSGKSRATTHHDVGSTDTR